jgi:hypothetical protein
MSELMPTLAAALAKAQGSINPPAKTRKVDFTDKNGRRVKYNYADLADVIDCIRKPLSENGLAVTHRLEFRTEGYGLITELIHEAGEKLSAWYPLPEPGNIRPQEFGSAITYARRYSLSALLGIASEEDDDAEAASPATRAPAPSPVKPRVVEPELVIEGSPSPASGNRAISEAQRKRLFAIATDHGWTHEQIKLYIEMRWHISSSKDISRDQYEDLIGTIQTKSYTQACTAVVGELGHNIGPGV